MNKILLFIFLFSYSFIANSQTADFTYETNNGLFCNPSTVQFTQTASGEPRSFIWNFGNGTITKGENPEVVYTNAGTYTVKMIVVYENNTVVITKEITVNPSITATIKEDRNYICTPGDINFSVSGNGNIASYDWDFGDASGIVSTATNSISHSYAAKNVYKITLKATDVSGCYDTASTTIAVKDPTIAGTVSPQSGCIPAAVNLKADVEVPSKSMVINYSWDFGDGSPITSTVGSTTNHNYNMTGSYSPSVTITTDEGCTNSYTFATIAFGTPPTNHVAYPVKSVVCGSEIASFVSKATKANSYSWNFGDGTKATVSDTIARHQFKTLGIKNVTVTPAFNGCQGKSITFQINVVGVIASFTSSNNCTDNKTFSFNNSSKGNLSVVNWNFGDSTSDVNTVNATHTFPSSGASLTTLIVTDNVTGCSDTTTKTIYTALPTLVNPDSSICRNSSTTFSIENNYNNPSATYTWNVAGKQTGPFKDSSLIAKAAILGNFNNFVIINNGSQYCKDTIYLNHKILVRGPELSFSSAPAICFDSLFSVINTSKPYIPGDSIITWYWDFGAGNTTYDVYQPAPYAYNKYGKYNVKLVAIDINGCADSLSKPITINSLPFVQTIPTDDTLCAGKFDTLIAFHNNALQWSSANTLSCATCDTVLANPKVTTKYYATVMNSFGCTYKDSVLVKVYSPFIATPALTDPYICQNDTLTLQIDPPMKEIVWFPATGLSNPSGYNPIVSPFQTTTYTATLTDSVGCFTSSADINVHIKSLPTVDAGPDATYPYNTNFSLNPSYSNNVTSYTWTPSSSLTCSSCAVPKGTSTKSETYEIKVTSDSGCIARDSVTIFVECKDSYILMPTAFTPNNDGLNDYYYPLTRGIKTIVRFSIYNRFGKLVYEAKDFSPNIKSFGWNGKLNNMGQSSSVFVYYIEAICDVGQTVYKKGSFILIK